MQGETIALLAIPVVDGHDQYSQPLASSECGKVAEMSVGFDVFT